MCVNNPYINRSFIPVLNALKTLEISNLYYQYMYQEKTSIGFNKKSPGHDLLIPLLYVVQPLLIMRSTLSLLIQLKLWIFLLSFP